MSYGLPYKGSKSLIAKDIISVLPCGNRLVDLFCGGCAVTDFALKHTDKFKRFLINDIEERNPKTYIKALNGGFHNEDRWISRQDFFKLKETDDYVRLCFSFGNDGKTYMYGPQIEPYKRAIHHIVFWNDYGPMQELCPAVVDCIHDYCDGKDRKAKRLAIGYAIADHVKQHFSVEYWQSNAMFRAVNVKWSPERRGIRSSDLVGNFVKDRLVGPHTQEHILCLKSLQSLESLERLQNLQSLQSLERLESQEAYIVATADDYCNYVYQDGDVVYCDPPYANTSKYTVDFDNDAFWQWCRTRDFPIYVSEYQAPEDFISIWCKEKRRLYNKSNLSAPAVEHLFLHKKWI